MTIKNTIIWILVLGIIYLFLQRRIIFKTDIIKKHWIGYGLGIGFGLGMPLGLQIGIIFKNAAAAICAGVALGFSISLLASVAINIKYSMVPLTLQDKRKLWRSQLLSITIMLTSFIVIGLAQTWKFYTKISYSDEKFSLKKSKTL